MSLSTRYFGIFFGSEGGVRAAGFWPEGGVRAAGSRTESGLVTPWSETDQTKVGVQSFEALKEPKNCCKL